MEWFNVFSNLYYNYPQNIECKSAKYEMLEYVFSFIFQLPGKRWQTIQKYVVSNIILFCTASSTRKFAYTLFVCYNMPGTVCGRRLYCVGEYNTQKNLK